MRKEFWSKNMVVPDARIYCGSVRREWKTQRHECSVGRNLYG